MDGRGVTQDDLRAVMRRWATGVTLVTAQHAGRPHGMTVSSFTSVSLDPPLVLVALERSSVTHRMVEQSEAFAVALLREAQIDLAERFAGRVPDTEDRFAGVAYRTAVTGAPIPDGCLATLDCRRRAAHPAGTHTIFVGEVLAVGGDPGGRPLLYYDRHYRRLHDALNGGT